MQKNATQLMDTMEALKSNFYNKFPKTCTTCQKTYLTLECFMEETRPLGNGRRGLMEQVDHPGKRVVDLWRQCACGTTLLVVSDERRNTSLRGARARRMVGDGIAALMAQGLSFEKARDSMLEWVNREHPGFAPTSANWQETIEQIRILLDREEAGCAGVK